MPAAPCETPRKMLPPPMTIATCTPSSATSFTSRTMRSTVSRLIPKASAPMSASPDSLSRMRGYAGCAGVLASAFAASAWSVPATSVGFAGGVRSVIARRRSS